MPPTANIWTSLPTQTITELIALLPDIIKAFPASGAPAHLYEFLVSNMKGPECEDEPPNHSSTAPESEELRSESTGDEMRRQLRPRKSIAPKPAAQTTLRLSSRVSESQQTKKHLQSKRTTGAKSKRCCRDGERVELFEGPPKKRTHIDDGQEDSEEDTGDEDATWRTDGSPPPPDPVILTRIAELANLSSSDDIKHIQNLLDVIQKQACATLNPASPKDLTLEKLIRKCQSNDENGQYVSFVSMIDNIRLAFHLASFKRSPSASFTQLDKDMGLHRGSVSNMSKRGQRLAFIACAGTPYILLLMAVSGMAGQLIHRSKMTHDMVSTFSKILRSPKMWTKEDGTVKHVTRIVELMTRIRMQPQSQLQFPIFAKGLGGCSEDVVLNFSDVSKCDELLSTLPFNTYNLPERDSDIWRPLLSPDTFSPNYLSSIDHPAVEMADRQLVKIKSPLCMSSFCSSPVNKENRSLWTGQERQKAMKATRVMDLCDIQPKMNELFAGGIREDGQYLHISHEAVKHQDVKFVDKDGKLLGLLISQTSPIINDRLKQLQDYLHLEMPSHMVPIDSSLNSGGTFPTMHFDYFTRYGEQGNGAPTGIHPDLLRKAGKLRVNHMQRIPYASSTIHANREQYSVLTEILRDICRLIAQAMEKYLPNVYSRLEFVCSLLPMGEHPVTAPFTGLVLNIQCNTTGHLDADDDLVCCVIPFGQFSDGQFVQYETGLVFDIVPGDFFIFPSSKITHFNLHFSGFRGSLVLHSDGLTDSWVKDRNGWINHMNTTFDSSILL